uniref:Fe2OG dioxygenase domain-containing protein n=1 Tax=Chrysotila carterae TaxID=13221 RepID=A0A7S4B109_CHRCT
MTLAQRHVQPELNPKPLACSHIHATMICETQTLERYSLKGHIIPCKSYFDIEILHHDPPVYRIPDFLNSDECRAIIEAAQSEMTEVPYTDGILIDKTKLWPLAPLGLMASVLLAACTERTAIEAAVQVAAAYSALSLMLATLSMASMRLRLFRCFTGTKWSTQLQRPSHAQRTHATVEPFLEHACALFRVSPDRFEVPTVTKYAVGQFQREHTDARVACDSLGLDEFSASGGQRLAQLLVYLQPPLAGGETSFRLFGFCVKPRRGDALVFPTAFADGTADQRYVHAGEPVTQGEKWNINTWLMQYTSSG